MACTLSNKCAKNLSKRTVLLQLIIKNVVTCFLEHSVVRGTATELDVADLRPGLTVAAADGVIRSARYDGASPYKQR